MDKMTRYRELIRLVLSEHIELANRHPSDNIESALVADDEHGRYMWIRFGWTKKDRIRAITVYVRLENNKIWIEEDWTEDGIATELVGKGVPKEDIVLAFHPPEVRSHTDFAAA